MSAREPGGGVVNNDLESAYRLCATRSDTHRLSQRVEDEPPPLVFSNHLRTAFQHDRDKILYCDAFRRLRLKTQIFPEDAGDHLRTRLDHTLEVSQIARHLSRQLGLNEDLADAIALAHDIGHTPFAHSGERALHNYLVRPDEETGKEAYDGLKHNWQGLRVVDRLVRAYPGRRGLNLTRAVRVGLLRHTGLSYKDGKGVECPVECRSGITLDADDFSPTDDSLFCFEAQVVKWADEIAQAVHDFEDAVLSESSTIEGVIKRCTGSQLIEQCVAAMESRYGGAVKADEPAIFISRLRSQFLFTVTRDLVEKSGPVLDKFERENLSDSTLSEYLKAGGVFPKDGISLGQTAGDFEDFLKVLGKMVVQSERVNRMDGKADYVLRKILDVYLTQPLQVHDKVLIQWLDAMEVDVEPSEVRPTAKQLIDEGNVARDERFVRAAVDYLAGMTDRFALREYDQLFAAYPRAQL